MIPTIQIDQIIPVGFYDEFELTKEEIDQFVSMVEDGREQEALDSFIDSYILPPGTKFSDLSRRHIEIASLGLIDKKEVDRSVRNISLLASGLSALLVLNFSKYMKSVYGKEIFSVATVRNAEVRNSILKSVISEYEQLISGSMVNTQTFVINSIRTLQREMIAKNYQFNKLNISQEVIDREISLFKKSLKNKYPEIFKSIEDGNILVSSKYTGLGPVQTVRHYKLDYYADLATRATLLNANRITNVLMAQVYDERVVAYEWIDTRQVKKDREICQEILADKRFGASLIALDSEAANVLGIMTLEEVLNHPESPTGLGCRHGFVRCDQGVLKEVNKILREAA